MSNSNIPKGRKSIFKEEGLGVSEHNVQPRRASTGVEDNEEKVSDEITGVEPESAALAQRIHSQGQEESKGAGVTRWLSKLASGTRRPRIKSAAGAPRPSSTMGLSGAPMIVLLIVIILSAFSCESGRQTLAGSGADAAVIRTPDTTHLARQNSPTNVCARWAGQCKSSYTENPKGGAGQCQQHPLRRN